MVKLMHELSRSQGMCSYGASSFSDKKLPILLLTGLLGDSTHLVHLTSVKVSDRGSMSMVCALLDMVTEVRKFIGREGTSPLPNSQDEMEVYSPATD